jgi:hypothetical protein
MSEELTPIEPEVVSGEVIDPHIPGISWQQWFDSQTRTRHWKLEVTDEWYLRANPWDIQILVNCVERIQHLSTREY